MPVGCVMEGSKQLTIRQKQSAHNRGELNMGRHSHHDPNNVSLWEATSLLAQPDSGFQSFVACAISFVVDSSILMANGRHKTGFLGSMP